MPEIYDFRQPMTLTREHSRALEVALQTFARQWATLLSSRLGTLSTVELESLDLTAYDAHIQSLPSSTTGIVLQIEPSRSPALLQIPSDATMTLIDCMLGGPATTLAIPFREMTDIEWQLMGDMLAFATKELAAAFRAVAPMTVAVRSVKYNPAFMQLVAASEPVVVARFVMTIGPVSAPVTLMLIAEPLMASLRSNDEQSGRSEEEQREHDGAVEQLSRRLDDVPLPVAVRFGERLMSAAEIASLEVGSVLPLRHPVDRPLDVVVGDVTLAHAAIGANGTRAACLVVSTEEEK